MQNLNRFVTYVYSYKGYEKDVNVGFAKADKRGDYVRMEIQIRKKTEKREKAGIYLLVGEAKEPTALPIGSIYFENVTGIYKGNVPTQDIEHSGYSFEQVKGLYIKTEGGIFASQWVEEQLNLSNIRLPKESKEKETESVPINPMSEEKENADNNEPAKEENEQPTVAATEQKPLYDWRYEWEKLDQSAGTELVLGLALWTRNKGKS